MAQSKSLLDCLTSVRWGLFRLCERLLLIRQRRAQPQLPHLGKRSLWVFVSTIGELNLLEPQLLRLRQEYSHLPLVLISDRNIYRESYLRRYPDAHVVELDGYSGDYALLAQCAPPALFVLAEIPSKLSDAPCRLPYAAVYYAKKAQAKIIMLNAWLYGYQPGCRMDVLESRWLGRSYLQHFDLITTHNTAVRHTLIEAGAKASITHVTGNIKLDATHATSFDTTLAASSKILASLAQASRPVIVAGCITNADESNLVLSAFKLLLSSQPQAMLILAPRHPENIQMMSALKNQLSSASLSVAVRTSHGNNTLTDQHNCLILDTFGELRDFYAISDVSYVGVDHNILEPISLGKPVTTQTGWESTYPSYPIYCLALEHNAVSVAETSEELCIYWQNYLTEHSASRKQHQTFIQQHRGATERNMLLIQNLMDCDCK